MGIVGGGVLLELSALKVHPRDERSAADMLTHECDPLLKRITQGRGYRKTGAGPGRDGYVFQFYQTRLKGVPEQCIWKCVGLGRSPRWNPPARHDPRPPAHARSVHKRTQGTTPAPAAAPVR